MPERPNVYYDIVNIAESSIEKTFSWLVTKLEVAKLECPRYIIFCRRHSHVHQLYAYFDRELGGKFDETSRPYEMFHGSTDDDMKTYITNSFAEQDGIVRVLFATIAFGMGVDCKNLHQIIHYGPPSSVDDLCQETGRCGRDGAQSYATLVIYPSYSKFGKTSKEMKDYISNTSQCRRIVMLENFPGSFTEVKPSHFCCDVCFANCKCAAEHDMCSVKVVNKCKLEIEENLAKAQVCSTQHLESTSLDVSPEGKKSLETQLRNLRLQLCNSNEGLHTGVDMTTGLPVATIKEILKNLVMISCADDIRHNFLLLNTNLANDIMLTIEDVRLKFPVLVDQCANNMLDSTMEALDNFDLEDTWTTEELEKGLESDIDEFLSSDSSDSEPNISHKRYRCRTRELSCSNSESE